VSGRRTSLSSYLPAVSADDLLLLLFAAGSTRNTGRATLTWE
jgi:hypothetical protein